MKSNHRRAVLAGLFAAVVSASAWAHGENKPGPHGGEIRMPGSFHTELKLRQKRELEVYLLDVSFANPVTKNSKVDLRVHISKTKIKSVSCLPNNDRFICKLPEGLKESARNKVEVTAIRDGVQGGIAEYRFPFKVNSKEGDAHGK